MRCKEVTKSMFEADSLCFCHFVWIANFASSSTCMIWIRKNVHACECEQLLAHRICVHVQARGAGLFTRKPDFRLRKDLYCEKFKHYYDVDSVCLAIVTTLFRCLRNEPLLSQLQILTARAPKVTPDHQLEISSFLIGFWLLGPPPFSYFLKTGHRKRTEHVHASIA